MRQYLYTTNDGTEEARSALRENKDVDQDFVAGQKNYNAMLSGKLDSIQLSRDPDKELAYWK